MEQKRNGYVIGEAELIAVMFSWIIPVMMCIIGIVINGIVGGIVIGAGFTLLVCYLFSAWFIIRASVKRRVEFTMMIEP